MFERKIALLSQLGLCSKCTHKGQDLVLFFSFFYFAIFIYVQTHRLPKAFNHMNHL